MLPEPISFADGQRKIYGIAAGIAGVVYGLAVVIGSAIVVFADWGAEMIPTQLYILGGCLAVGSFGAIAVTIGLLVGGPVGRIKAAVSKTGVDLEAEGQPSSTTTTATITTAKE